MSRGATVKQHRQVTSSAEKRALFAKKWKMQNQGLIVFAQNLLQTPISTLMTLCSLAIILAFPLGGYVLLEQASVFKAQLHPKQEITAFLKVGLSDSELDGLTQRLENIAEIDHIHYQNPDQTLAQFKSQSDMNDVLSILDANPLPGVMTFSPRAGFDDIESLQSLKAVLFKQPEIDKVVLDVEWVKKFEALLNLITYGILTIGVLMAFGVVIILSNTIRLSLEKHREEIYILGLMGATKAFIRRPFVYRALFLGGMGALSASALVYGALGFLQPSVDTLARMYGTPYSIQTYPLLAVLGLTGISLILSWLSVRLALFQYDENRS